MIRMAILPTSVISSPPATPAPGLRAWRNNGDARRYFIYDGTTPICETDDNGNLLATNVYGPDGLVSRNNTYYVYDPLGNVYQRYDAQGNYLNSERFDAWGVAQTGTGYAPDPDDPFGYKAQCGYYTDRDTGMILCTFRYYDPSSGRWITGIRLGMQVGRICMCIVGMIR